MTLKIVIQNALDAFSESDRTSEFIALVERLKPDVAIFPEAYDADRPTLVPDVTHQLKLLGYSVVCGDYDDADGRKDRQGFMLLTRKAVAVAEKPAKLVRIGGRNMVETWLRDPITKQVVHVLGVHLNDRSEALRQTELDDLQRLIKAGEPTVVAGDFNSLYHQDAHGFIVQSARFINRLVRLHLFPAPEPVTANHPKKNLGRVGNLSTRLTEMASGKTMDCLLAAGFTDADSQHLPTHPAKKPLVQLDHVMFTPQLTVCNFALLPRNSSDHLGVIAVLNRGQ